MKYAYECFLNLAIAYIQICYVPVKQNAFATCAGVTGVCC